MYIPYVILSVCIAGKMGFFLDKGASTGEESYLCSEQYGFQKLNFFKISVIFFRLEF